MENSDFFIEARCLPDAPEYLQKYVKNHNWALKNYFEIVKKVGAPGFAAIYRQKVVDFDESDITLAERLGEKYPQEEYNKICIVPVEKPVIKCMSLDV